jgi:DNA-binding response OmpR family regulator
MPEDRVLEFHNFRLDVSARSLTRDGELVPLAPKIVETLILLAENPGKTILKERLWATAATINSGSRPFQNGDIASSRRCRLPLKVLK